MGPEDMLNQHPGELGARTPRRLLGRVRLDLLGLRCRLALIVAAHRLHRVLACIFGGLVRAGAGLSSSWAAGNLTIGSRVEWALAIWPHCEIDILGQPSGSGEYQIRLTPCSGRLVQAKLDGLLTSTIKSDAVLRVIRGTDLEGPARGELLRLAAAGEPVQFVQTWTETGHPGVLTLTEHLESPWLASAAIPITSVRTTREQAGLRRRGDRGTT